MIFSQFGRIFYQRFENFNLKWNRRATLKKIVSSCNSRNANKNLNFLPISGIYEKLPYLKSLGIGCIWLSPILKSPMVDFGYDVSNFREIDPLFGDMDDLEALIKRIKQLGKYSAQLQDGRMSYTRIFIEITSDSTWLGLRIIMDFVPNHTSDDHEWFQKSVKKISPYTDYYIWRDPQYIFNRTRAPPNNWVRFFSSSVRLYFWDRFMKQNKCLRSCPSSVKVPGNGTNYEDNIIYTNSRLLNPTWTFETLSFMKKWRYSTVFCYYFFLYTKWCQIHPAINKFQNLRKYVVI